MHDDRGREPIQLFVGRLVKGARIRSGWTERELAHRLRTNQAAIQRLEAGRQQHLDAPLASDALDLFGIRLSADTNAPGMATRDEQRDALHARCCGYVSRQLQRRGWEVRAEVEIGTGRFRGWIDLLGYRPADGALLCQEVKTRIDDFGRTLRSLAWYGRESRDVALALGWRPRMVVRALLVLSTIEVDARLAAAGDLVRTELPGTAANLTSWIDGVGAQPPRPSIALIDPGSRRHDWLIRTRGQGRRAGAPYADYRDAAARLAGRGR